ncbi:hypothetical protein DFH08DRAFT_813824 [Mycena albidolilacea]|uniref:Uncharacterized protein n=1 Tax=Mycena albidolilacea TaxID=1033008 RepID=A0AAD7EKN5_9AGAR|nr:hypothetical protein DFH08DRAFT_813824 [Mycena albidolilacea]
MSYSWPGCLRLYDHCYLSPSPTQYAPLSAWAISSVMPMAFPSMPSTNSLLKVLATLSEPPLATFHFRKTTATLLAAHWVDLKLEAMVSANLKENTGLPTKNKGKGKVLLATVG